MGEGVAARFEFGQHSAGDNLLLLHRGDLRQGKPAHDVAVRTFYSRYVGEEDERVGLGADSAGGGHFVGVDIVVLAVEAEGDGRDDGDGAHSPDGLEPTWICCGDFTYKAEVGCCLLFASTKDMAVATRESDCCLAVRSDSC